MTISAILTIARPDGTLDEVGMNYRTPMSGTPRTIRAKARQFARGRAYRIEFLNPSRPFSPPTSVEMFPASQEPSP